MSFHDGGTGFSNPVIGGDGELVIDDVHSRGYANGVSGWSIRRDGSAEFNQVLIRGTMTARDGFNEVRVSAQDAPWTNSPAVTLNPDLPTYAPGLVQAHNIGGSVGQLNIRSPYPVKPDLSADGDAAFVILKSDVRGTTSGRSIELQADTVSFTGGATAVFNGGDVSLQNNSGIGIDQGHILMDSGSITLFGNNARGDLNVNNGDINMAAGLIRAGIDGLVPVTFVNGWGNFGGQFADCCFAKRPDGFGVLTGVASGGTTTHGTAITKLPVDYIPEDTHVFTVTGTGGRHAQIAVRGFSAGAVEQGNVVIQSPDAGLTWFSFGGVEWPLPTF